MRTLYLCGAGNPEGVRLALTVNADERRWYRAVILDDDPKRHGQELLGVPIAGPFALLAAADRATDAVVNLVARTTRKRAQARERIAAYEVPFASLIDPSIDLSWTELGSGVTVYRNATVSALSRAGDGAVLFANAVLGHGASIGAGTVLAPGAVLNARVQAGEGAYFGTNSSVLPDLKVGSWATVAAGSAVVEDVPEGATVMGVPGVVVMTSGAAQTEAPSPAPPPPPSLELEASILEVWQELLPGAAIGPEDNFFDRGGTSQLAIQLASRLREALGTAVAATEVFRSPTVRKLAASLGGSARPADETARAEARGALRRRRFAAAS